jgi:hypothetical protein
MSSPIDTATVPLLTSLGRIKNSVGVSLFTVWRVRNSTTTDRTVRLDAVGGGFNEQLIVAKGTEVIVRSPVIAGSATHRLFAGTSLIGTKAAGTHTFADSRLTDEPRCP